MPKPVSFTRSKKLGDTFDPDIQPWKDDEQKGDKSAQELQGDLERKIQGGEDVVQSDIFSGQTQVGGSSGAKGYKIESPEAGKQYLKEIAGFDIDMEIELRQSIADELSGKQMEIDVRNKPGVQAEEISPKVSETKRTVLGSKDRPFIDENWVRDPETGDFKKVKGDDLTGKVSNLPNTIEGSKGMDLATSRQAFRNAEELQSLKIQRAGIVRKINKEMYDVNYDADVLTRTDVDAAISVSKGEGISVSEAVVRNKQTATERLAEAGDAFEVKEDWKQTSAYDYSLIEEGNKLRDYQEDVKQNRFQMTNLEDRIDATGTQSFKEYPKGGGRGGVVQPNLGGVTNRTSSSMQGGGVRGLGYKQADILSRSIVPFTPEIKDNIAELPFAMSDYSSQAERILGKQAGKQHMKDIVDDSIGKLPMTDPDGPVRGGKDFEAVLAKHRKIESAAAEFAMIRKDVTDIYGSYSKSNVERYFQGKGLASSGAFRDVRSATIAGVDLNKLGVQGLPATSKKMENRLAAQNTRNVDSPIDITGATDPDTVDTRYGSGHDIKQEGPAGTKNPQVVVPNPDAPDYNKMEARREAAYRKREISLGGFKQIDDVKKAQKILSTPPVGLSEAEVKIQKDLRKAVTAVGSLKLVKNLSSILNKSNPALNVLSMLPKKTYEDILKKSGIIYKKPQA